MTTPQWEITVVRKPVYNSLTENILWRLDVRIKLLKQYGIENVLKHDYKYSMFETKCESDNMKNDKFYASSDDITDR